VNFTADLDLFLADFGVPVTAGAVSGMGIYDKDSEVILGGGDVVRLNHSIKVRTDLFGNLNYGDSITVNGSYFTVEHEPMRSSDGAFSVVPLKLATGFIDLLVYLITEDGRNLITEDGRLLIAQTA